MDVVNLGIIAYFVGILLSVLYPYLTAYLETGESFDWKFAVSRVIAVVIAGGLAIVAPGFVDWLVQTSMAYDYPALYFLAVMFTTFGVGAFGRQTQKFGNAVIAKNKPE